MVGCSGGYNIHVHLMVYMGSIFGALHINQTCSFWFFAVRHAHTADYQRSLGHGVYRLFTSQVIWSRLTSHDCTLEVPLGLPC